MSLRTLAIVAGAGDPDPTLALRIDVVTAAERWYDATELYKPKNPRDLTEAEADQLVAIVEAGEKLRVAVMRYRKARAKRVKVPR